EAAPVGHAGTRVEIHERPAWAISGWFGVLVVAACTAAAVFIAEGSGPAGAVGPVGAGGVILRWLVIVPLTDRRSMSIRVRNFETNHLKVNDADGNPVEIAAIVVWQVADTSRAVF